MGADSLPSLCGAASNVSHATIYYAIYAGPSTSALLRFAVHRLMSSSIFVLIVFPFIMNVRRFSLGHYSCTASLHCGVRAIAGGTLRKT